MNITKGVEEAVSVGGHLRFTVRMATITCGLYLATGFWFVSKIFYEEGGSRLFALAALALLFSFYLLGVYLEVKFFQKWKSELLIRWFLLAGGIMLMLQATVLMFSSVSAVLQGAPVDAARLLATLFAFIMASFGYALGRWAKRERLDLNTE